MKLVTTDTSDHELITTIKKIFKYDQHPHSGRGWPLPIIFDRTSNVFRVMDFPTKNMQVEFDQMPSDGDDYVFESPVPIQFARDVHLTKILYRVQ